MYGRHGRQELAQAGLFVSLSTLALTATFLGVVGLVTGGVSGLSARLPFYVLSMAATFVGSILFFEETRNSGRRVLERAAGIAGASLVLVTLGGEGIIYLVQRPEQVVSSQSLFYLFAAGLIGTGLGYWALNHWSDLRRSRSF